MFNRDTIATAVLETNPELLAGCYRKLRAFPFLLAATLTIFPRALSHVFRNDHLRLAAICLTLAASTWAMFRQATAFPFTSHDGEYVNGKNAALLAQLDGIARFQGGALARALYLRPDRVQGINLVLDGHYQQAFARLAIGRPVANRN